MASRPVLFGLPPNVAGMLAYAPCGIGLLFSIVIAAVEKQNGGVRFHAFQSLLIYAVEIVIVAVLWVIGLVMAQIAGVLGFLSSMVMGMVGLGFLAVQVLLMIKAYHMQDTEVMYVGGVARRWV